MKFMTDYSLQLNSMRIKFSTPWARPEIFIKNSTGNFSVVNFLLQRLKGTGPEGIALNTKLIHCCPAIRDNFYLRQKEYLSA